MTKIDKLDVLGALNAQLLEENGSARKAAVVLGWKNGGGFRRYAKTNGDINKALCALSIKQILRKNQDIFDEALAIAKASMVAKGGDENE